jgi:hypothetical protein
VNGPKVRPPGEYIPAFGAIETWDHLCFAAKMYKQVGSPHDSTRLFYSALSRDRRISSQLANLETHHDRA